MHLACPRGRWRASGDGPRGMRTYACGETYSGPTRHLASAGRVGRRLRPARAVLGPHGAGAWAGLGGRARAACRAAYRAAYDYPCTLACTCVPSSYGMQTPYRYGAGGSLPACLPHACRCKVGSCLYSQCRRRSPYVPIVGAGTEPCMCRGYP